MHIKKIFCILLGVVLLACVCIGTTAASDGSTIVQGEQYSKNGMATGSPGSIQWYLFGPNYFKTGTSSVIDGVYEVSFSKAETKVMGAGEYYLVVQHPMYNKVFNIGPVKTSNGYVIKVNNEGPYTASSATVLFNVNDRQSANAVYALEEAIRSQNIDDMLDTTKITVVSQQSESSTRSSIYEGTILPVSGSTTGHVNDMVTVEVYSGGFAPSAKGETANTDQYRIKSTQIGESGDWLVNINTTGLTPGDYTVAVTVGQLSPEYSTVTILEREEISVVTQAPTVAPTEVPTPQSTPASSGFGFLTLLGLCGALLLTRK